MKYFSFILILSISFFYSCSKKESKTSEKPENKTISKHKDIKTQEAPPREIINVDAEKYTVEDIRKIDKEIPVLEIIAGKKWAQAELDKLSGMEMLDTLRLDNMDLTSINFDFTKTLKALKKISIKNSKVSEQAISNLKQELPQLEIEK